MTVKEIEELIEDTKRLPRATDKVAVNAALASLEIAKQLIILNETFAGREGAGKAKTASAGKKK
jgi:hypothetical protein